MSLLYNNACLTECPIQDSPQCTYTKDANQKCGKALFWAPQDYHNFTKVFFRNQALTKAFIKPEILDPSLLSKS